LLHSLSGADKDIFFPEIFSLWFWEPVLETKCLSMVFVCHESSTLPTTATSPSMQQKE